MVPIQAIPVTAPEIEVIPESEREVVGEKVIHRLAQEPGRWNQIISHEIPSRPAESG